MTNEPKQKARESRGVVANSIGILIATILGVIGFISPDAETAVAGKAEEVLEAVEGAEATATGVIIEIASAVPEIKSSAETALGTIEPASEDIAATADRVQVEISGLWERMKTQYWAPWVLFLTNLRGLVGRLGATRSISGDLAALFRKE